MKYFVTINGKKYEVDVEKAGTEDGSNPAGQKSTEAPAHTAGKTGDASLSEQSADEETVKAPMPGTILSVKVNEGQKVKKGEVLFILEAMKMENEIMAGRDGVVTKIAVPSGTAVKTGDILALLK